MSLINYKSYITESVKIGDVNHHLKKQGFVKTSEKNNKTKWEKQEGDQHHVVTALSRDGHRIDSMTHNDKHILPKNFKSIGGPKKVNEEEGDEELKKMVMGVLDKHDQDHKADFEAKQNHIHSVVEKLPTDPAEEHYRHVGDLVNKLRVHPFLRAGIGGQVMTPYEPAEPVALGKEIVSKHRDQSPLEKLLGVKKEKIYELSDAKKAAYVRKAVDDHGHKEFGARQTTNPDEKKKWERDAWNRHKWIIRVLKGI